MTESRQTPIEIIRGRPLVLMVIVFVILLGGVNWALRPEEAQRWLRAMLVLPLLCAGLLFWYSRAQRSAGASDSAGESAIGRYFGEALTLVTLGVGIRLIAQLGLEVWVRFGDHGADLESERRILGLATSAVFLVIGNALPKVLTPLALLPLPLTERVTRARRCIGGAWVVLGLVTAIAFLATPLTFADAVEFACWIAGILTILGGVVWMNRSPASSER